MNKIIQKCKYEVLEKDIYQNSSKEVIRKKHKIDLVKFRKDYMSTNVNEGIKHEIAWTKMKKEERKIKEEIEKKQIKKVPKKAGGLTQEEIQELNKKKEKEDREAKRRHLERAYAGIDKKAR